MKKTSFALPQLSPFESTNTHRIPFAVAMAKHRRKKGASSKNAKAFQIPKLEVGSNLSPKSKFIRNLTRAVWILAIVLLVVVGVVYSQMNPTIKKAVAMATTVMPETFTELYFNNHLTLPTSTISEVAYSFSFTVHNLEYKDMAYPYEVYISSGSAKQMISTGTINLHQNEYKSISEDYTLPQNVKREEVIVNLINKKQQIDFWIGNNL